MATIDVAKWRAAGVPADLIAILVEMNRAASRIPARGLPGRGIASITPDVAGGGVTVTLDDGTAISLSSVPVPLAEDDAAAIALALQQVAAYSTQAGEAAGSAQGDAAKAEAAASALADLPNAVVDIDIENGRIIKVMANGDRVEGPLLPAGPGEPSDPPVSLTITPVSSLPEDAAVGTVVASIETDATSLVLDGTHAGLLAIDGDEIVTTAPLTDLEALEFTVKGTRASYAETTTNVSVAVEAVDVVDPPDPPTLTADITTLTAGEEFEIAFIAEPDRVTGNTTLIQSDADPLRYNGVAPADGFLAIRAEKTGWTDFDNSWTYAPVVVAPDMVFVTEPDQTISIDNVDPDGEAFDVQAQDAVLTLDPADFEEADAIRVLDAYDVSGEGGDGLTLTRSGAAVYAANAENGAIVIGAGNWFRDEDSIPGAAASTYVQDDAVDGDKTLTFREPATNDLGTVWAVSNGVYCPPAVVVPAGWWEPLVDTYPGSIHIDFANGRVRKNGVTYATLAEARTAGATIANSSWDKAPITTGPAGAFAVRATMPPDAPSGNTRYALSIDDGADGTAADNLAFIEQTTGSASGGTAGVLAHNVLVTSSRVLGANTTWQPWGTEFRAAVRFKAGAYAFSKNGILVSSSTNAGAPPVCTEMVVGNRSDGARAWTGTILEAVFINGDLTGAELDALLA